MASERSGTIRVFRAGPVFYVVFGVCSLLFGAGMLALLVASLAGLVNKGGGGEFPLIIMIAFFWLLGLFIAWYGVHQGFGAKVDLDALDGELRSSSAETRASAASSLHVLPMKEIMKRAVPLLTDADPRVRAQAVGVLAAESAGAKLIDGVLASDAEDDAVLRGNIFEAIVRLIRAAESESEALRSSDSLRDAFRASSIQNDKMAPVLKRLQMGAAHASSPAARLPYLQAAIDAGLTWEVGWTIKGEQRPRFPDRCCVCGKSDPGSLEDYKFAFQSKNVAYSGLFLIPVCPECEKVVPERKGHRRARIDTAPPPDFILWSPSAEFVAAVMSEERWGLLPPVWIKAVRTN